MLIVTYDLNNKSGLDLILPEIRRYKSVRLGPAAYALVAEVDLDKVQRQISYNVLPGDKVWIFTADGPCSEIHYDDSKRPPKLN